METTTNLLGRFLIWRVRNISQKHLTLILSFVIGVVSGLAAIILKNTIHFTHQLLTEGFTIEHQNWLYLAYPLIGIFITVLFTRYVIRDDISHGVTKILHAFSR
ncbi:MAG: chloride channel protein, partial [Bacteroidota bacterium]